MKNIECGFHCIKANNIGVKIGKEEIIKNVNLHIHCKELTVIIGKNGAGKTTLLKAILGEIKHTGKIIFTDTKNNLVKKLRIGYVPQSINIEKHIPTTVYDMFASLVSNVPVWLKKDKKIFKEIESIRKFKTPSDISKWEELREIVLKHPFDNQGIHELYDIYCEFEEETDYYYCAKVNKNEYKITGLNPNFITINEEFARLKLLLKIPDVKEYFISKGYATEFKKSKYLLLPNVFQKIYLGALGECVGEFLLNQYLSRFKLKLQRIEDINKYEKFDFVIGNDIYVDFKHWTGIFDKDRESEVQKFLDKLNKIEGKIGFIINILKPENYDPKQYISPDENLIIIPYLYDTETNIYNLDALKIIDEYLLKKLSFAI